MRSLLSTLNFLWAITVMVFIVLCFLILLAAAFTCVVKVWLWVHAFWAPLFLA